MKEIYVKFDTVNQVLDFVNLVDRYNVPCRLKDGKIIVNAKSILGVLRLDLSKLLLFDCSGELNIISEITPYIRTEDGAFKLLAE